MSAKTKTAESDAQKLREAYRSREELDCSYAGPYRDDPELVHCPVRQPCAKHAAKAEIERRRKRLLVKLLRAKAVEFRGSAVMQVRGYEGGAVRIDREAARLARWENWCRETAERIKGKL
jgi:hypothetical protein